MTDFFHGWRRKTGVVTLVAAMVFVGGWVRSLTIDEGVSFRTGQFTDLYLGSCPDGFIGSTGKYSDSSLPSLNAGWFSKYASDDTDDTDIQEPADSQWHGWGFQFRSSGNGNFIYVVIPYWSIVLPLTLLSAYLLLGKPRKKAQCQSHRPNP